MGYSRTEYAYAGGAQDFVFSPALGVLDPLDVQVYVAGEVDGLGDQVFRAFTWITADTIRVTAALPNPCTVFAQRTVAKDQLETDFSGTGSVTKTSLSRGFKQLMMNIHELLDGRLDSFSGPLVDSVAGIRDEAQVARVAAELAAIAAQASADGVDVFAAAAAASAAAALSSQTASAGSSTTASTAAATATTKASEAAASAATAVTQGGIATTKAGEAAASAASALLSTTSADTSAATATTKASEAVVSAAAAALSSAEVTGNVIPVGTVAHFASTTAPVGWLMCDGSAVTSTWAELRSFLIVAGNPFGTSGADPLLPDLRGEFIRGFDAGRGVDVGRVFGTAQADQNKAHTHGITDPGHNHAYNNPAGTGSQLISGGGTVIGVSNTGNRVTGITINSDGGSEARPRNVALLACIKAFGHVDAGVIGEMTDLYDAAVVQVALATTQVGLAAAQAAIATTKAAEADTSAIAAAASAASAASAVAAGIAAIPNVTSGAAGLAPASGGGTANFLRADGTWAAPAGGGGGSEPGESPGRMFYCTDFTSIVTDEMCSSQVSGTGAANAVVPWQGGGASTGVGFIRGALGTVATNRVAWGTSGATSYLYLGLGIAKFRARGGLITLSDGTNCTYQANIGFLDAHITAPAHGCFFRYTHSVNGGKWQAVTRASNVETATDTLVTADNTLNHTFYVEVNAAGTSVSFFIDGTLVATHTTNIPLTSTPLGFAIAGRRTVGTIATNCYSFDYLVVDLALPSRT